MKNKINFDGILSFFILAATIWTDYIVYTTRSIPFNWRIMAIAIISIIGLLMVALSFKKLKNKALYVRRGFIIFFIVIFAFGSINLSKVTTFTRNVTDVKDKNVETISVVVKSGSKIDKLSDLKNKTVYYQNGTDEDNAKYVKNKINDEVSGVTFKTGNNYFTLANQLLNGEIDVLIISNPYIRSVEDGMDGFPAMIKTIQTYDRKVSKIDKKSTGDNLDLTSEPFTVFISGMDETGDPNVNSRSDVNMLLLVNPNINHVEMISFPRDSFLPNPALSNVNDKLTHTGNDGVENSMMAIEQAVGFDINFYVKINFTSVVEMVNALGDITVDVPIAFCEQDSQRSFAEQDLQCLEKGEQKVNGEQALAFARHRKTEGVGDIGRTHAQQKVMSAMISKALTLNGATKIPTLLDIIPNYVVTNISDDQLNKFISYELENMAPWTTTSMTLENGFSDNLITASMGSTPLSCYILSKLDLQTVWEKYWVLTHPTTFKDFSFSLNDLTPQGIEPKPKNNKLVYAEDNLNAYRGTVQEEVVEKEEVKVETPKVEEAPVVPEKPVTPEKPNTGGGTTPETPETPETPTTPETPVVPETPVTPPAQGTVKQ